MKRIGLLSDTHGYLDPALKEHFQDCDEIWHAGDIGSWEVMDTLATWGKTLRAVYGNIDDHTMRRSYPEDLIVEIEGTRILMTHIAGSPGKYNPRVRKLLETHHPHVLICGHSHILKVVYDERFQDLYINPGAAGRHGFHIFRTAIRFTVLDGKVSSLEAIELGNRGRINPE